MIACYKWTAPYACRMAAHSIVCRMKIAWEKSRIKLSAELHAVHGSSIYTLCVYLFCVLCALVPLNEGNDRHDSDCRIINIMENSIKLCDNSENHFLTLQWKFVRILYILFSVFWFHSSNVRTIPFCSSFVLQSYMWCTAETKNQYITTWWVSEATKKKYVEGWRRWWWRDLWINRKGVAEHRFLSTRSHMKYCRRRSGENGRSRVRN